MKLQRTRQVMLACLLAFLPGGIPSVRAEHYRVYLIGGQSNATGRADAAKLEGALAKPQPDVRFYWHRTMEAPNAGHLPEDRWIDLAPGSGHGKSATADRKEFGVEVSFGRAMADAMPDARIAIIKYSVGGSSLHRDWAEKGGLYTTFVEVVKAGLKALESEGHTHEVCGMLWQQGENDAGSPVHAGKYEANLRALIGKLRKDIAGGSPMPFVIGGLSVNQNPAVKESGSPWFIVRQSQEKVARDIGHGGFADADGCAVRSDEQIHFNHEGIVALGREFAREMRRIETGAAEK